VTTPPFATIDVGAHEGFTLVEFLLAAVITVAMAGVIFSFAAPAHRVFQAQPEQSDLQQRLRVGVESLTRDLVMAGAGTYSGPATGPLTYRVAPILPYRAFGDTPDSGQGTFFRRDAISFIYVSSTPSQTTIETAIAPGALDVQLAWAPNCPATTATQICGLENGDRLLVVDAGSQWDVFSVDQIGTANTLSVRHRGAPSPYRYEVGATATEARLGSYYLKIDEPTRTYQLMRHDGWATELPVVDDVVRLEFQYFGDPVPPRLTGTPLDEPGPWTTYGPAPPPLSVTRGAWPPGENCTFLVASGEHVARLTTLSAVGGSYVELTPAVLTDGPWCPDGMTPNRFDADLLRVRQVRVTLRVQSALASLRGPAGALFLRGGTAKAGERYVPDVEVQFDVAPRNLNLAR